MQRFRVERCKVLQFRIRSVLGLRDEESIDEDQRDYDSRVEDSKLKIWIASVQHPKLEVSAKFKDSSVQDSRVQSPRQRDWKMSNTRILGPNHSDCENPGSKDPRDYDWKIFQWKDFEFHDLRSRNLRYRILRHNNSSVFNYSSLGNLAAEYLSSNYSESRGSRIQFSFRLANSQNDSTWKSTPTFETRGEAIEFPR